MIESLSSAIGNGRKEVVEVFISSVGIDDLTQAFILAIESGHRNVIEILIKSERSSEMIFSAFNLAVKEGNLDVIQTIRGAERSSEISAANLGEAFVGAAREGIKTLQKLL